MANRRTLARRGALACIGSGAVVVASRTLGAVHVRGDRIASLTTVSDPNAYFGVDGIGTDPHEEIEVINNSSATLEVTVSTTDFRIVTGGSDTSWTFTLSPGSTQTVEFYPENANRDDFDFTGEILESGTDVGTIEFTRAVTIPFQPGNIYHVESVHNGYFWDVEGFQNNPGANVITWPDDGGANQEFEIVDNGDGTYRFEPQHASNRAVGIENGSTAQGDSVVQRQWSGGGDRSDRRWELDIVDSGAYRITNVRSGHVADVDGFGGQGADVIQWPWKGSDADTSNQEWILKPA